VGTKSDLEKEREVTSDEAKDLAFFYMCPYLEISALENVNLDKVFVEIVRVVDKKNLADA